MDVKIKTDDAKIFNYCARAIIQQDDKFLIMNLNDAEYYHLPGGHVEIGESSADALNREIKEEVGIEVNLDKIVLVSEEFYRKLDLDVHSVIFYYLAKPKVRVLTENSVRMEQGRTRVNKIVLRWVTCDELAKIDLRPTFMKDLILKRNFETFKHYVD